MDPAAEWTSEVARSCAAVAAAVGPRPGSAPSGPPVVTAAFPEGAVWQYAEQEEDETEAEEDGYSVYQRRSKFEARPAPEFDAAAGLLATAGAGDYTAAATAHGAVQCFDSRRRSRATAPLPWPAAIVSCCGSTDLYRRNYTTRDDYCYGIATRRGGGAVCVWNMAGATVGGGGAVLGLPPSEVFDAVTVHEVAGLPPGDAVAAVGAGSGFAFARTVSGALYGFGRGFVQAGFARTYAMAIPIASRYRVRCIACSGLSVLAQTENNRLACYPFFAETGHYDPQLVRYRLRRSVPLPLRDMAGSDVVFILADALGGVHTLVTNAWPHQQRRVVLPEGRRAVRVAAGSATGTQFTFGSTLLVALTECGELWDCMGTRGLTRRTRPRCINAAHPGLPLGLMPCGGYDAQRIILLPDRCCGKARLRLWARIAVRLGLPCDPLGEALPRYAVASCYIVGPPHDPFSWPDDAGGGGAAFGR